MHQNVSFKEDKGLGLLFIFMLSTPLQVHITEDKYFLNYCKSRFYVLSIWFVCPGYFLLALKIRCQSPLFLCRVELIPWASSQGSLAPWLPVSFNQWVSLARHWNMGINIYSHILPSWRATQVCQCLYQRPQLPSEEVMHFLQLQLVFLNLTECFPSRCIWSLGVV